MKIELEPGIEPRLRAALRKAGGREIGGMLMAEQVLPGHFRIMDFSLDALSGSYTGFRRDPKTHQTMLDEFFERTGRDYSSFNYLGEWHSHPSFSIQPSRDDIATMTEIVGDRSSTITFAVLLIVRLRWRFWIDCSLTVFARGESPRPVPLARHRRTELRDGCRGAADRAAFLADASSAPAIGQSTG